MLIRGATPMGAPIPLPALLNFPKGTLFNRDCIGGSISGAYFGMDAIPDHWIKKIEKTEFLGDLALRLSSTSAIS